MRVPQSTAAVYILVGLLRSSLQSHDAWCVQLQVALTVWNWAQKLHSMPPWLCEIFYDNIQHRNTERQKCTILYCSAQLILNIGLFRITCMVHNLLHDLLIYKHHKVCLHYIINAKDEGEGRFSMHWILNWLNHRFDVCFVIVLTFLSFIFPRQILDRGKLTPADYSNY